MRPSRSRRRVIWLKGFGIQQERKRASPSPHRSSRWGEDRGEGQMPAQTARSIFAAATVPPRPSRIPAPHPIPSPRGAKNAAGRGDVRFPRAEQRGNAHRPLPIVLHDGERVGVRGRCRHRRLDPSLPRRRCPPRPSRNPAPHPIPSPRGVKNAAGRGDVRSLAPSREETRISLSPSFFTMGRGSG